ncbi:lipocalin family protein [Myroides sp. WP-1]|uniref:lipocalin family protein n=1 Tax=Myroides sp. WP-1 TaxID=2759944 RepID=UPI0015F7A8DF|nr:lipocalin family protein [Myroides sp. WP-1]MBB1139016.1 lipocalin family protein [Myroides sp. WP-1]
MKKIVNLFLLVVLTLGLQSCKEQEATKVYELEDLVGTWKLSSAKLYDREAKFLADTSPKDEYGCGPITWVFTSDRIEVHRYTGKDPNGQCLEEVLHLQYTLQNNTIHTLDDNGMKDEMLLTNLTSDEVVFMTSFPNPLNEENNAIKYTEIRCKKVK